ncbi:MAG: hypothetical protein V1743_01490 [Nanoarchaeota archaeon]
MAGKRGRSAVVNTNDVRLSRDTVRRINGYRDFFAAEMIEVTRHLREFKVNKEEFYRRWSAYSDFKKVEKLFKD